MNKIRATVRALAKKHIRTDNIPKNVFVFNDAENVHIREGAHIDQNPFSYYAYVKANRLSHMCSETFQVFVVLSA
jgi:hypothetical protein